MKDLDQDVKDFVSKYFEVKPNDNYAILTIDGVKVQAIKDTLHNDSYITVRYNDKEVVW
jgi:hypothetical protein